MTSFEQWREWRERCALGRCGAATTAALRGFAWLRFSHYLVHAVGEERARGCLPDAAACWHLFETHLTVARPRSGRRYKEWLFARLEGARDAPLAVICGGASLVLRSVVRDFLLREGPIPALLSLDAPVGDGEGPSLAELLPAPPEDADGDAELRPLAINLADRHFDALPRRERILLLARILGVSLGHPLLLSLLDLGQSRAFEIWRGSFQRLAQRVCQEYPRECEETRRQLLPAAAGRLQEKILLWGGAEKALRPLFVLAEAQT